MKKFLVAFILLVLCPFGVEALELDLHSKYAYVYDPSTEEFLYRKGNAEEETRIASLTKIMTTIVAIENIEDLNEEVTITQAMLSGIPWDASIAGLKIGDNLTYEDLLYASLLPSGADATMSLAHLISGSVSKYIELMNEKASSIGMNNTHFVNVTGYDTEGHTSTLDDVLKLLTYSLKNDTFKRIYTTKTHTMKNGKVVNSTIDMYNKLYDYDLTSVLGSKTGFTSKAGMCMSALINVHDRELILITLGAEVVPKTAYNLVDTKTIIDGVTNGYENHVFFKENTSLFSIPVVHSKETEYSVKVGHDFYEFLEKGIDLKEATYEYDGKKKLSFKDSKGSIIGHIKYYYEGTLLGEEDVFLTEPLTMSPLKYYGPKIVLVLIIILMLKCFIKRKKKKRRRKYRQIVKK